MSIELPTEIWCEILKHFDIKKRKKEIIKQQKELEKNQKELAKQKKEFAKQEREFRSIRDNLNQYKCQIEEIRKRMANEPDKDFTTFNLLLSLEYEYKKTLFCSYLF